jgi:hypothetical protein
MHCRRVVSVTALRILRATSDLLAREDICAMNHASLRMQSIAVED